MPESLIDLHLHISLTDPHGVCGQAACRELMVAAEGAGVQTLLVTPHTDVYLPQATWQEDHLSTLAYCRGLTSAVKVCSGSEFLIRHLEDVLLVGRGLVPTLNQTKYILVEFPPDVQFDLLSNATHELRVLGFRPLIAHPERYQVLQRSRENVEQLLSAGALLQGTLSSLLGVHGSRVRQTLRHLLQADAIFCLASDFHGGDYAAVIRQATSATAKQVDQAAMRRLLFVNPERILAG